MSVTASYTTLCSNRSTTSTTESKDSSNLPSKMVECLRKIESDAGDCIAAMPGNVSLLKLPNADDLASEWMEIVRKNASATTVQCDVPLKVLTKASEQFTDSRQWSLLFAVTDSMHNSKTGVACLHSKVMEDVLGGWRNAEQFKNVLQSGSAFRKVILPAKQCTATGYRLSQQPDPKAPVIFSKNLTPDFHKYVTDQALSATPVGEHSMACGGGVGLGWGRDRIEGKYRVQSIRVLVDLGNVWNAVRESMSKRWGHIDAASDGAGRLDHVSEFEAVEIAERQFQPDDSEITKAAQRAAAIAFCRYIAMDRESRIKATKMRANRMYLPGMELRSGARLDLLRYNGERLVTLDVRAAYWWCLCAEIRRALMLTRDQGLSIKAGIDAARRIENVERLICLISAGKFYEYFAEKCSIGLETVKSRINMLCLFNKHSLGGPEFRLLEQEWPEVAGVIRRIRSQYGSTSTLSRFLNGLEGQLMNGALKILADAGYAVVRMHDGLLVPEEVIPDAIAAIRLHAESRFGIMPGLKIEKPDGTLIPIRGEIAADSVGESDRYWQLALPTETELIQIADDVIRKVVGVELSPLVV